MLFNIMYDPQPMYPKLFHPIEPWKSRDYKGAPKHSTRTMSPVRYYFIDFGLSRKYDPADGPPREPPVLGGDKSVPEFQGPGSPCDPFPTDVYYLGNVIKTVFLDVSTLLLMGVASSSSFAGVQGLGFHEAFGR